jgi:MraZ protein
MERNVERENTELEDEIRGLSMFVGDFTHTLDTKKRLTIPSVWRAQIEAPKSFYVLPDSNHRCLNLYPSKEMLPKLDRIRKLSMSDAKARHYARVLGRASDLVSWDSQGRIRIKDNLLDFAGLKDEVVMVGAIDRIELWSAGAASAMWREADVSETSEIAQRVLKEAGDYVGM